MELISYLFVLLLFILIILFVFSSGHRTIKKHDKIPNLK